MSITIVVNQGPMDKKHSMKSEGEQCYERKSCFHYE